MYFVFYKNVKKKSLGVIVTTMSIVRTTADLALKIKAIGLTLKLQSTKWNTCSYHKMALQP